MTELDLEAIKARYNKATPEPWCATFDVVSGSPGIACKSFERRLKRILAYGLSSDDREFVAHARADVPALVAEVERLRAALTKESDRVVELLSEVDKYEDPLWYDTLPG